VSALFSSRQVRLPTGLRRIVFRMGRDGREITIPCSDLAVRLEREGAAAEYRRGFTVGIRRGLGGRYRLEAAHKSCPGMPVLLARGQNRDDLVAAFKLLGKFLGTAVDDSMTRIESPDGQDVIVSPEAIGGTRADFFGCELVVRSAKRFEMCPDSTPKRLSRVLRIYFLAVGLIFVGLTAWTITKVGFMGCTMLIGGVPFVVMGWVFGKLAGRPLLLKPARVEFDLARGVVVKSRDEPAVPELATGLPLDRLAALQICSYVVDVDRGPSCTAYELNAVLRGPGGKRFRILADSKYERLLDQAEQLRDVLKLQLIDNA
jgi:hypothetical protein